MKTNCPYCAREISEEGRREEHDRYCPMQYPMTDCKVMALADWQAGFDAKEPQKPGEFQTPVWELGYLMGHSQSAA